MKKKVLFLCGGRSGEHEISLISTKHILKALNRNEITPTVVMIQKRGRMDLISEEDLFKLPDNPKEIAGLQGRPVDFRPYANGNDKPGFVESGKLLNFDAVFPVLHGEGGEDGSIQGFLETAQLPYVGCKVGASANTMDKIITKKICMASSLPVAPFVELSDLSQLAKIEMTYPCFVKPATGGSSIGVSKVESAKDLKAAVEEAFRWSTKLLIEPAIVGRELEIAVLDDGQSRVLSPAGEIICRNGWYDYDTKYVHPESAELVAPAELSAAKLKELQDLASKVFDAMDCRGMARVDFFLDQKGQFLLNEVNSIPGFTPISMYPRLLGLAGVSYPDLIARLLNAALRP